MHDWEDQCSGVMALIGLKVREVVWCSVVCVCVCVRVRVRVLACVRARVYVVWCVSLSLSPPLFLLLPSPSDITDMFG